MRISRSLSIVLTIVLAFSLLGKVAPVFAQKNLESKATITVDSAGDQPDSVIDGVCKTSNNTCTLRAAIQESNVAIGTDTIIFSSDFTIQPATNLPTITDGAIISGLSHAITIIKPAGSTAVSGLVINSGDEQTRIHHLIISGFQYGIAVNSSNSIIGVRDSDTNASAEGNIIINNSISGIEIEGSNNSVSGNYVGVDALGASHPNRVGIRINARDVLVGTDGDGVNDIYERNIISGNDSYGIEVQVDGSDAVIAGNYIGVIVGQDENDNDVTRPNLLGGVLVDAFSGVRIGTDGDNVFDANEKNVISGNGSDGIRINSGSEHTIKGNLIGLIELAITNVSPNNGDGIEVGSAAHDITIGIKQTLTTYSVNETNVISSNEQNGILIYGYQVTVAGNYIGTNIEGIYDRGNHQSGIAICGHNNIIGTDGDGIADAVEGNVISGNDLNGITVSGADNSISGNLIGLGVTGNLETGNSYDGIALQTGSAGTSIGVLGTSTSDSYERNTISGNERNGIRVASTNGATIYGNYIGTDDSGNRDLYFDLGNGNNGILIQPGNDSSVVIGIPDNGRIAHANVISDNTLNGILVDQADNHIIAGNKIGTNAQGGDAIPNDIHGIEIKDSANIRVGTNGNGMTDNIEGNVISGNSLYGLQLLGSGTINTIIAGNYIGVTSNGSNPIPNLQFGIYLGGGGPVGTRIGTNGDGVSDNYERNAIAANLYGGIMIASAGNTMISGNRIGMDIDGEQELGNGGSGIKISGAMSGIITIGIPSGGNSSQTNIISANDQHGIHVESSAGHIISGNLIGLNAVDEFAPNGLAGIRLAETSNTIIGTDSDGVTDILEGNIIAGNSTQGVHITGSGSQANKISRNSFYQNSGLAIDLDPIGVNPNDGMDLDTGPNGLQNHPVIRFAYFPSPLFIRIIGDFNSTPSSYFILQFYASQVCDPSGFGEGRSFLQEINLMTDANGTGYFDETIPFSLGPQDQYISAILIADNGNTSEFSPVVQAMTTPPQYIYLPLIRR